MATDTVDIGMSRDVSEDEDSDDEVSLLVVDEDELKIALEVSGISINADAASGSVEVSVESEDVSTFLMFAPEEEYLGAKVTGFVPREDGGLSALEMHGQLVEGDVLTHLNGSNARLLEFTDILKACRGPERGGLPRPLVMKFSRPEFLTPSTSPAQSPPSSPAGRRGENGANKAKADGGGNVGGSGGASSLLADLDDFMGGLSLPGFASGVAASAAGAGGGADARAAAAATPGESRKIPGMSHIKGVLRAEFQAQGMLGGGSGGNAGAEGGNTPGEGLFLNMLRRLEQVDVMGEDSPRAVVAAAAGGEAGAENGVGSGNGGDRRWGDERGPRAGSSGSAGAGDPQDGTTTAGAAGGVGSSFAGVGAKLRFKFRKPSGGFGLAQGGGGQTTATGGGGADGVGEGGKAFVEGASKALAMNRERVMGWMKELRPKDWTPKEEESGETVEEESIQELRRAVRRLYLDAPDPAVHTAMVVARARPPAPKAGEAMEAAAVGGSATTAVAAAARGVDRVVGTGADRHLTKLVWFRSSSSRGFAKIKGVHGPYYQPSADDVGMRICIKCTLAGPALDLGGTCGLSPAGGGRGRRDRHAGGGGRNSHPLSPQWRQAQITFAEVGPIVLDSAVGAEVDRLLAADGVAVFQGLVRRDTPGDTVRVRVDIGPGQVRVLAEPDGAPAAVAAADGKYRGKEQAAASVGSGGDVISVEAPPGARGGTAEGTAHPAAASSKGATGEDETGEEARGEGVVGQPGGKSEQAGASAVAAGKGGVYGGESPGDVAEPAAPEEAVEKTDESTAEGAVTAAAAVAASEGELLAEGLYSSGVLVALDPARPTIFKLTVGAAVGGGGKTPAVFLLGATDGRQRDVLALTLRGRRLAALGPEVSVDDFPEETKAQRAEEDYLNLKAAAANFARAYDEDGMSAAEKTGSSSSDEDDDDDDDGCGGGSGGGADSGGEFDDDEEPNSTSCYDTSDDGGEATAREGDSTTESEIGERDSRHSSSSRRGGGDSVGNAPAANDRGGFSSDGGDGPAEGAGAGALPRREAEGVVVVAAAPWEKAAGGGGGGNVGGGGGGSAAAGEPRSLSDLLEDLRQARAIADSRERQLKEAHSMSEACEATRLRAEAELALVSSELDLLRPFSRSLAARAEGKEAAEARANALADEAQTLREQLAAAVDSTEKLRSRVGTAEDEAGAAASKLSGLERVIRRLGGEAEVAHAELANERASTEEAAARASKAERELDQARARAAVLDNKLAALEKEKLKLVADANAFKARAGALEEKYSAARIAEEAASQARVSELEDQVLRLEEEKRDAVARMEEALSKQAEAEANAEEAIKKEEETSAEMARKTEEVMRLTAQRNSAKSRADSLAKDLSRVCGGGRTLDQIEIIVARYADLKVKMANLEAEKDGEADLKNEWPAEAKGEKGAADGRRKISEAANRALRENTELKGRVAAMAESLQMRKHQLEGQKQSNEFLLKRVEELEEQIANTSGKMAISTD